MATTEGPGLVWDGGGRASDDSFPPTKVSRDGLCVCGVSRCRLEGIYFSLLQNYLIKSKDQIT